MTAGWGGDGTRSYAPAADPLALLRWSDVTYAAVLARDGTVTDANAALEQVYGMPLTGLPATELVAEGQRRALTRMIAAAPAEPQRAVLGFTTGRPDAPVTDRTVQLRCSGADLVLIAEPAVREQERLVDQVLGLNDDLVDARRRLERRTTELEQARGAVEAANQKLRYLESIGAVALSHQDLDEVLPELLRLMRGCLGADRAAIWLYDDERDVLVAAAALGMDGALPPGTRVPVGAGVPGEIAATRLPLIVEDLAAVRDCAEPLHVHGGAFAGVPLKAGGRLVGVAHVMSDAPDHFREEDLGLLRLMADRAALAILRVQDLARHRRIGVALQEMLLPARLPTPAGVALAARYVPGSHDADVGGDWFDAIELPGGRVGVAIGDVAGRGLEAAATMGQLRHALRAYALEHDAPAAVLQRLDRLAAGMGAMATACYAVVETMTGEGVFASSGHLPPLLLDNGRSHFLEARLGPPLGVGDPRCEERPFALPAGGGLLLYTDGLVENRGEVIDRGLERLRAALPHDATDPQALCNRLLAALGREAARDDVALIACRRL